MVSHPLYDLLQSLARRLDLSCSAAIGSLPSEISAGGECGHDDPDYRWAAIPRLSLRHTMDGRVRDEFERLVSRLAGASPVHNRGQRRPFADAIIPMDGPPVAIETVLTLDGESTHWLRIGG